LVDGTADFVRNIFPAFFPQDQVRRLRELSGLRMPYMRPSVRAVIDLDKLPLVGLKPDCLQLVPI
jgi:hypothetical protein